MNTDDRKALVDNLVEHGYHHIPTVGTYYLPVDTWQIQFTPSRLLQNELKARIEAKTNESYPQLYIAGDTDERNELSPESND